MTRDYRPTVFLPKTEFPMRGNLPNAEPEILKRWEAIDLWGELRRRSKGKEKFVLHDGPPYANGHLHMGHALNKILKDVVSRSQQMLGKDSVYVPGWDCHGLPIEWKVEEGYRAKGLDKDQVPRQEFRQVCRDFAAKWIGIQATEFKRLGVLGDWDRPYMTMSFDAEAQIVRELGKFLVNGGLYRGDRPVLWSVVEKTALADAEVEYQDHTSTTIWVRFPVVTPSLPALEGASVVIWTTTPWTMPGNRAIGFGEEIDYRVIRVTETAEGSRAKSGEKLVLAAELLEETCKTAGITGHEVEASLKGEQLAGTICRHPLNGQGYDHETPLLAGDFVTTEQGTGFVHIAPGHGADDFQLGRKHGIQVPQTVGGDGLFLDHVPLFAGLHVFKADNPVAEKIDEAGGLLARGKLVHSYPHSWRSKAPLIFRNTPQWFISMETNDLRKHALTALANTRFVPGKGKNRLTSMIEQRPDWCISRQRLWGVPLPIFINKKTGEPLRDGAVIERVAEAVAKEGGDAWYNTAPEVFLGDGYDPAEWEQEQDIVEVWFDSGSTHSYVLETRDDLKWPADLYLEGSDQHRGWFHTSLLESCGTRGRAPFDAILTHGFLLDEQGRKMSKSMGNGVEPEDVMKQYGVDIMRLWVVGSDFTEDLRVGPEILKQHADLYRRIRNTFRFLLGNLAGFSEAERLPAAEMPELERWILHRLVELDALNRRCVEDFDFHSLFTQLHQFCAVDLSSFYLDIRKDSFYCDASDSIRRRAARTVIDRVFDCLVRWMAPFICFTADEAWRHRTGNDTGSIHLETYAEVPADWRDDALGARWSKIRDLRRVVTGAIELERAEKRIGASLQAHPTVYAEEQFIEALARNDLAELAITSDATLVTGDAPADAYRIPEVPGVAVVVGKAEGEKCARCWQVLPEVPAGGDGLCRRCTVVVSSLDAAAE